MHLKSMFILCLVALLSTGVNAQNAGELDVTFNTTGYYTTDLGNHDNLNHVLVQPDGKVLSTGVALDANYAGTLTLERLNSDGTPDISFGNAGIASFPLPGAETYGVISQLTSDQKIIVGGIYISTATYYADFLLIRLHSDGSLDTTFGDSGFVIKSISFADDLLQGMAIQEDGKIVVSGSVAETFGFDLFNTPCIVRFTADGEIDQSFGTFGYTRFIPVAGDNELTSCLIQPDGKIVASGHYQALFTGATDFDILVVRVTDDGTPDALFGDNGKVITAINDGIDDAFGMDIDQGGNIIVGGFTTLPVTLEMDMVLLKYDQNGLLIPGFGVDGKVTYNGGAYDVANDVKVQSDDKIVACGAAGGSFFDPRPFALWRYNPDGTLDNTFGTNGVTLTDIIPGGTHEFNSLALQEDGKIVTAGKFMGSTNNDIAIARYDAGVINGTSTITTSKMVLFPNPSHGTIQIKSVDPSLQPSQLILYSTDGKPVLVKSLNTRFEKVETGLPNGIYMYQISKNSETHSGILVIE